MKAVKSRARIWPVLGLSLAALPLGVKAATNGLPAIFNVTNTLAIEGNPVWVTAGVTDVVSVASVTLWYTTNATPILTNTVFWETMAANVNGVSPWTGNDCDNAWTVNYNGSNPFSQLATANYGSGNPCGLQFTKGTTNLADSMVTTANGIAAIGNAGYVEFYLKTANLTPNNGWAFQLNDGSGFVTRLTDMTGSIHTWQLYHYDLQPGELVSGLNLRFQFAGGANSNKIDLDQISVQVVTGGGSWTNTTMDDDGLHGDGAADDGIYGGEIPAFPAGSSVNYFLTASDTAGLSATNPVGAPGAVYHYSVAPAVSYDLMLGRPTDSSIAVNVLASQNLQVYFQYGVQSGIYTGQTATSSLTNGAPAVLTIGQLQANQRYYYRMTTCIANRIIMPAVFPMARRI